MKGSKPRIDGWEKIIEKSKLDSTHFKNLYPFQSSYSHSEFISILQIRTKSYGFNELAKQNYILLFLHLLIARCIIEVKEVFPSIESRYTEQDISIRNEVQLLYEFSKDAELKSLNN